MNRTLPSAISSLAVLALLPSSLSAAVVAQYTFTGGSFNATNVASGVNATAITENGFTSVASTTNPPGGASNSARAVSFDQIDAAVGDHYFEFTLTPTSGTLDLGQLSFVYNISATGAANQSGFRLSYRDLSAGPGFLDLGTTAYATSTTPLTATFDLSSAAFDNLSSGITFRIDVMDSGSTASNASARIDNIFIDTVPEPSGALFGLIGVAGLILRRRR